MNKNLDKIHGSALALMQVALKPRVIGRNRTRETLRYFYAHSMKGLSGVGSHIIPVRGKLSAVSYDGFKTPGNLESAILEEHRRITMQTASFAPDSAQSNVIYLADHLPRYTAAQLIAEARRNRIDNNTDAFDTIRALPDILPNILELILFDFDLRANQKTTLAVACRGLAAYSAQFIDLFQEVDKGGN